MYIQIGRRTFEYLSLKDRRKRARSTMQICAEQLHKQGLDSRIPFLKYAFIGQDVGAGSTARKEDGIGIPDWREGDVLRGKNLTMLEVQRFNIFNAERGLQALKGNPGPGGICPVHVVRCKTALKGDLRVSLVPPGKSVDIPYGAVFNHHWNQVLLDDGRRLPSYVLVHEMEHARHLNLGFMLAMNESRFPARKMEYLAMLAETMLTPFLPMVDIIFTRKFDLIIRKEQIPHLLASAYFMARLVARYGMDPRGIKLAHTEWSRAGREGGSWQCAEIERIRQCARKEYEREYARLFRMPLEDIQMIIDDLPMI